MADYDPSATDGLNTARIWPISRWAPMSETARRLLRMRFGCLTSIPHIRSASRIGRLRDRAGRLYGSAGFSQYGCGRSALRLSPYAAASRPCSTSSSELGRVRDIRWGPRTIDLDLLLYEEVVLDDGRADVAASPNDGTSFRARSACATCWTKAHALAPAGSRIAQRALQDGEEGIALWKTINWHSASAHSES